MLRRIKHRICGVYDIGYSYTLDTYVLAVNVLALWRYTRYYSITKEEYNLHRTAKGLKELDNIAWQCISAENQHKRFLCSDMMLENTPEQESIHAKLSESLQRYDASKIKFI